MKINKDFSHALKGIFLLPSSARFGVYTAYKYYLKLLKKLRNTNPLKIKSTRIRVPNYQKINVPCKVLCSLQIKYIINEYSYLDFYNYCNILFYGVYSLVLT